jgi:TolB-like protein/Flp pilus assembly protein TadD
VVALVVVAGYALVEKPWVRKPPSAAIFAPPPHSIAVLPFVNMSGDKEQEYFSEGLTEELLNSLARINELQVSARTSSFSFKGKDSDIGTIARRLNVGAVLEGSVRRSGNTVRVTTQLINAVTGYHIWSQTYDRDLGDVLRLQTDIATAVAGALKVTLLSDVAARVSVGGTRSPAALDAYLRGLRQISTAARDEALRSYSEAVRLDPEYALAYAGRALATEPYLGTVGGSDYREGLARMQADARKAIALAPDLAEAHVALGAYLNLVLELPQASAEFERAVALAPGSARVLAAYGEFASCKGRTDAGLAASRRAVELDPLSAWRLVTLASALGCARRYEEAIATYRQSAALSPDSATLVLPEIGILNYLLGNRQSARTSCETATTDKIAEDSRQWCLALTYAKLDRQRDAEGVLAALKARWRDDGAYGYAETYAQWGDLPRALAWLETALKMRANSLAALKTDPLLDPLRNEPRFQAVVREIKFPD